MLLRKLRGGGNGRSPGGGSDAGLDAAEEGEAAAPQPLPQPLPPPQQQQQQQLLLLGGAAEDGSALARRAGENEFEEPDLGVEESVAEQLRRENLLERLRAAAELRQEHEAAQQQQQQQEQQELQEEGRARVRDAVEVREALAEEETLESGLSVMSSGMLRQAALSAATPPGSSNRFSSSLRSLMVGSSASLSSLSSPAPATPGTAGASLQQPAQEAAPASPPQQGTQRARGPKAQRNYELKAAPLLVLQLDPAGVYEIKELGREEVLRLARLAVPPTELNRPATQAHAQPQPGSGPSLSQARRPAGDGGGPGSSKARVGAVRAEVSLSAYATTIGNGHALDPSHVFTQAQAYAQAQHAQPHLSSHQGWIGVLQPRDVRVFDPSFSHSHDPEVLVRRHSVLINLDPVKALVLRNLCLVFVPAGADGLLGGILLRARELQSGAEQVGEVTEPALPFELMMYESIFASVCTHAEDEYNALRPEIKNTLASVLKSSSGPIVVQLRNMEQRLGYLLKKVSDNRYALNEVLESDRNMALMLLGEVAQHPERFMGPDEEHWTADHESIELLVESYLQRLDSVLAGLRDLQEELTSVRAITTLRLSSAQNKLLSVDLLVKCVTAAMTYASLFGAVFGMTLNSDIKEVEGIFWPLFFVVSIGSPLSIALMFWAIRSRGLMIT